MHRAHWLLVLAVGAGLLAACSGGTSEPTAPSRDPLVAQGETLFQQNCATCHSTTPETVIVGPSLAGVASRAGGRMEGVDAEEYILLSIIKPSAYVVDGFEDLMPSNFGKTLTGEELDALVAYLLTLE